MFLKYIAIFFSLITATQLFGQENIVFSNDRYGGISSVGFSPTQAFLNPNPWDINLIAEDVFFQNDYAYISNQSFLGLRHTKIESTDRKNNITGENTPNVLDFYNGEYGNYHFSSDILGPSFSFKTSIKERAFSFGLFSRLRTQSSAIDVDNYLKFSNQGILEPEHYILEPLQLNLMNWGEIGLNVATEIFPYSDYHWIVGVNMKYAAGFDALMIDSRSPLQLTRTYELTDGVETKTISASDYQIAASVATNYNFDRSKYELKQTGKGFGLDVGITMIDYPENSEDYNFKASMHVLDIGQINFRGQNHYFEGNTIRIVNNPNLTNTRFRSPQQYFELLSKEVYGDTNSSFRGTDFSMGLPTSLHLNVSKNVGAHQYINADLVQRLPFFENSIKRSNIFNLSYSVQKPFVGYGASISTYEYRTLQFGGYFRIGPLILGSENVFPLIFKHKKLHAGDFYIALKIYPFWDNEMKRHRREDCYCDEN